MGSATTILRDTIRISCTTNFWAGLLNLNKPVWQLATGTDFSRHLCWLWTSLGESSKSLASMRPSSLVLMLNKKFKHVNKMRAALNGRSLLVYSIKPQERDTYAKTHLGRTFPSVIDTFFDSSLQRNPWLYVCPPAHGHWAYGLIRPKI